MRNRQNECNYLYHSSFFFSLRFILSHQSRESRLIYSSFNHHSIFSLDKFVNHDFEIILKLVNFSRSFYYEMYHVVSDNASIM